MKEKIPVPPLEVQRNIAALVFQENRLKRTVGMHIEMLREYCTRLIFDVVTGKSDVRDIEVPDIADDDLFAFYDVADETDELLEDKSGRETDV